MLDSDLLGADRQGRLGPSSRVAADFGRVMRSFDRNSASAAYGVEHGKRVEDLEPVGNASNGGNGRAVRRHRTSD
jgi:hypothetical protein